ncbi:L,D-transpeptidase [Methylophilaceae bacterium]|jgi:L,D-transpeptidase YbiS|nr:L,D-transpeptidase [Methylophilaceae bacterium]
MKYQIIISIKSQNLLLLINNKIKFTYKISTAKAGIGQIKGSYKTPLGHHIVRAKIGENNPIYSVYEGRRPTGDIWNKSLDEKILKDDWILTRILWLSGKEIGLNRLGKFDSMQRFIYIHGTNEENLLGSPASHGCIRMANQDILALFKYIEVGTDVFINAK